MSSNQITFNEKRLSIVLKSFFQSSTNANDDVKSRIIQNHNSSLKVTTGFNKNFEKLFGKKEPTIEEMVKILKNLMLGKQDSLDYCLFKYCVPSQELGLSPIGKIGNVKLDVDKILAEINFVRKNNNPPQSAITKEKFLKYISLKLKGSETLYDPALPYFTESQFFEILLTIFKFY